MRLILDYINLQDFEEEASHHRNFAFKLRKVTESKTHELKRFFRKVQFINVIIEFFKPNISKTRFQTSTKPDVTK